MYCAKHEPGDASGKTEATRQEGQPLDEVSTIENLFDNRSGNEEADKDREAQTFEAGLEVLDGL